MDFAEDLLLFALLMKKKRGKKRTVWVHPLLKARLEKGLHHTLYDDLRGSDDKFFMYFRMSKKAFDELLSAMEENLRKQDSFMRDSISPEEKLALTLRSQQIRPNLTSNMSLYSGPTQANSTVDCKQIEYYSSYADKWWNPKSPFMLLQSMNPLRVPLIRDGLIATKQANPSYVDKQLPLKGIKILDVGCGGGFLCEPLARLGAEVTGIDASEQMIEVAKAHAQLDPKLKDNPTYLNVTAEEHALHYKDYYDAVVSSEVIEHVCDQILFVQKCVELTKPGGSVFMTTLTKSTASWLIGLMAEYILRLFPKGTLSWDLFITPEELEKLFEKYGCQRKQIQGMMYFPLVDKWCRTPGVFLSYAIQVVKNPV